MSSPAASPTQPVSKNNFNLVCLLVALLAGGLLRLFPFIQQGWVLGDGGLFWAMSKQIAANHFWLPRTVFYPTQTPEIPFCYPPLAFYLAAVPYALGVPLPLVFTFLPFALSLALIVCFWRLARTLFHDSVATGVATLMWALYFNGFSWHIMGGGLPRALGLCCALIAIEAALRLWRDNDTSGFWVAAISLSLAGLTHLERARFGFVAVLLLWLFYGHSKRSLLQLAGVWGIAVLGMLPWLLLCWSRFGWQPFLSAAQTDSNKNFALSFLYLVPFFASLFCLRKRLFFVPVWALVITFFDVRSGFIFLTLPLALGLGAAVETSIPPSFSPRRQQMLRGLVVGMLAFLLMLTTFTQLPEIGKLSQNSRSAMSWVTQNSPANARFLLMPTGYWSVDLDGEWFPALTQRTAVATVQSSEWLPNGEFARRVEQHQKLLLSSSWPAIQQWQQYNQTDFDWIFLPINQSASTAENFQILNQLRRDLESNASWRSVYKNDSVEIFKRTN